MMALIDRIDPDNENRTIGFHEFSSGIFTVLEGIFTLNQFKSAFGLDSTDDPQIALLQAEFNSLDNRGKDKFRDRIESLGVLWEQGRITKAQFTSGLGL